MSKVQLILKLVLMKIKLQNIAIKSIQFQEDMMEKARHNQIIVVQEEEKSQDQILIVLN